MALVSPGVEVTIIDQSQYLPAASNSVPFVLIATAANKANPSGTDIAPGTLAVNANKLYQVTSQRDLVSLFGNPFFYKTTNGVAIQGYELNEYGLLAAYSLLGITNRCYVLRADIDLAQLVGQVTRPVGTPVDGTFWLDTTTSTWGVFEWNAQTNAFTSKTPLIITDVSLTDFVQQGNQSYYVPKTTVGNPGDYASVQIDAAHYGTAGSLGASFLYYKVSVPGPYYNQWASVGGGSAWSSSWPAMITVPNTSLLNTNPFTYQLFDLETNAAISDVVTISPTGATPALLYSSILTQIAAATANGKASLMFVDPETNPGKLTWYMLNNTDLGFYVKFASPGGGVGALQNLQGLGITNVAKNLSTSTNTIYQAWSPAVVWGNNSQQPRWRSFDSEPHPTGSLFLKSNATNAGVNLVLSKYATSTGVFTTQPATLYANDAQAIAALDSTGGKAIPANTTYTQYSFNNSVADSQLSIYKRLGIGPAIYIGANSIGTNGNLQPGEQFTISYTTAGNTTYSNSAIVTLSTYANTAPYSVPDSNDLLQQITSALGNGSPVNPALTTDGNLVFTHRDGGSILLDNTSSVGIGSAVITGSGTAIIPGALFTTPPTATFSSPDTTTAQTALRATATATVLGSLAFSGTAAISAINSGGNSAIANLEPGTYTAIANTGNAVQTYGTVATLSFTLPSTANANVANIQGIALSGGTGYFGNVSAWDFTVGNTLFTANANTFVSLTSSSVVITNAGSGYQNPTITVAAGSNVAVRGGVKNNGNISSSGITYAYSNTSAVSGNVTFTIVSANTDSVSNVATGIIAFTSGVPSSITFTSYGSNYTGNSAGTVSIVGTASGNSAQIVLGTAGITSSGGNASISLAVTGVNDLTTTPATITLSSGVVSKTGFSPLQGAARIESFSDTRVISIPGSSVILADNTGANTLATLNNGSYTVGVTISGASYTTINVVGSQLSAGGIYCIRGALLGGTTGTAVNPTTGTAVGNPFNDLYFYIPNTAPVNGVILGYETGITKPNFKYKSLLSNFVKFTYVANEGAPSTLPANNTQWYYSVIDEADIMIMDNGIWQGYRNVTMDVRGYNLTQTDPNGPIIATDAPIQQSDGTPLVYGDLWLDSNDLENYPALYRWESVSDLDQWVAIDIADQTTSNGLLFADVRWGATQTTDPVNDPLPPIPTLLLSNWTDPDAPSPTSYPEGMLVWNTRRSGYNIKEFRTNYFTPQAYPTEAQNGTLPLYSYTWVSTSGLQSNGAAWMGRKAQRNQVVTAMKATIATNMAIREEDTFFNLLAAPNYCELQPDMILLNNDRNNTAYIIGDTPLRLPDQATDITAWATNAANVTATNEEGLVSRDAYMGLYYPSGITTDLTGTEVVVPPSHMMLRTILRNDQIAYPWFAPAGTRRGNIDNANSIGYLDANTGEFQVIKNRVGIRDVLYSNQINPLAFFTGVGLLNYGNKNSQDTQSSLDRTNVARLVAYIRERLTVLARPYVFEPNDNQTRQDISGAVTTLLADILSKRGLYDYLVVCDQSNNTPARIDRSELWIDVAIEPAKAVEFIYIPVRILNTGEIAGLAQNG